MNHYEHIRTHPFQCESLDEFSAASRGPGECERAEASNARSPAARAHPEGRSQLGAAIRAATAPAGAVGVSKLPPNGGFLRKNPTRVEVDENDLFGYVRVGEDDYKIEAFRQKTLGPWT